MMVSRDERAPMQWSVCAGAELAHGASGVPYTYKGELTVILAVSQRLLPVMRQSITGPTKSQRYMDVITVLYHRLDAAVGC